MRGEKTAKGGAEATGTFLGKAPMIAKELNMKDHSSVSKALKAIESEIATDSATKGIIEELKSKIQQTMDNA